MNTTDTTHPSLEAKLDAICKKIDQLRAQAGHDTDDSKARLHARVDDLHERLARDKARRQTKMDAYDRKSDEALAIVGGEINELYGEVMRLPL